MSGERGGEVVRASDAERDAVVARLNAATTEGRLTLEEFSERAAAAYAALTTGELAPLVADLPAPVAGVAVVPVDRPEVVEHVPVGSLKRKGRWRLARQARLSTTVGSIKLDLRHAEVRGQETTLHVRAVIGSVKVWVPRHVR